MTWPPQSPDLNPIGVVWDELDRRVSNSRKGSQQVLSICGNSFKTVEKALQVKLVERMPRVCKAVIKAKGGYFEKSKICFDVVRMFWLLHDSLFVFFHSFDVFTIILQCRVGVSKLFLAHQTSTVCNFLSQSSH